MRKAICCLLFCLSACLINAQFTNKVSEFYHRGEMQMDSLLYAEAIQSFSKAVDLDLSFFEAYAQRAWCYFYLEQNENAIKDFDVAVIINPNDALTYFGRGSCKTRMDDHAGALPDYNKSISLKPTAVCYAQRGICKSNLRLYDGSIRDFTKAIKLEPNEFRHYVFRGETFARMERFEEAIEDLNQALKMLNGKSHGLLGEIYRYRSICKGSLKDKSGACLDLKKAIDIGDEQATKMWGKFCQE